MAGLEEHLWCYDIFLSLLETVEPLASSCKSHGINQVQVPEVFGIPSKEIVLVMPKYFFSVLEINEN